MSHKLNDITLYYFQTSEVAKAFTARQNVISDLYVQYLKAYKPPKTSRISVTLGDDDSVGDFFGSIISASAKFDKEKYWDLSDDEKNLIILDTVHRIALLCAEKYHWEKVHFDNAYQKVLDCNFVYEIEGKRKLSGNKRHKASICISKNLKSTIISAMFYDKSDNFIKSVELLESFQNEMFYDGLTRNNKWFSNSEFGIFDKHEELVIKANMESGKPETVINPSVNSRQVVEYYLQQTTYHELDDHVNIIKLINQ